MKENWIVVVSVLIAICGAAPEAHHGAAAFDTQEITTLSATVTELDWRSPHALIHFEVTDARGIVTAWTAETAGLVILIRAGWTRDVVKPGDRVIIAGHRAANGTSTMLLKRLVLPGGRELTSIIPPR
jgi:hydrogenase maturation factor